MNKLEQKIIDKFWENVIEVSPDGIKSDTIKVVSDDNVFDLIHQVREETIKEIGELDCMKKEPEGWGVGSGARVWGRNQLREQIIKDLQSLTNKEGKK